MPIVASEETFYQTSLPDESIVDGVRVTLSYTPPDIANLRAKPAEELTDTEVQVIAAFDRLGV